MKLHYFESNRSNPARRKRLAMVAGFSRVASYSTATLRECFVELQPADSIHFAYVVDTPHDCFIRRHPIVVADFDVSHLESSASVAAVLVHPAYFGYYYISHVCASCSDSIPDFYTRAEREFILAGNKSKGPRLRDDGRSSRCSRRLLRYKGVEYFFCNPKCNERFRSEPDKYLSPTYKPGGMMPLIRLSFSSRVFVQRLRWLPRNQLRFRPQLTRLRKQHRPHLLTFAPCVRKFTPQSPVPVPSCGMALEPETLQLASRTEYVCPMHPEVSQDHPGSLPKVRHGS